MQIICTKKLLDELQVKPSLPEETSPLYTWSANLIKINRRKTVVLMCEQNQYKLILYGLKAKDFKAFDERLTQAVEHTLLKQHINPEVIRRYLSAAGPVQYVKNTNRSRAAKLTHAGYEACCAAHHIEDATVYNDTLGVHTSQRIVGDFREEHFYPNQQMKDDLATFGVSPLIKYPALELTATLPLISQDAVRKLIVPADITFIQLHKILQAAFTWHDSHLFEFAVYTNETDEEPVVTLVPDEEGVIEQEEARFIWNVPISEYLPQNRYLLYRYDFGDNWKHIIEVTGVMEAYEGDAPICISGNGNVPPEDVGGDYAYEEFLKIMADPGHKEYKDTKLWSEQQRYQPFDLKEVNWAIDWKMGW